MLTNVLKLSKPVGDVKEKLSGGQPDILSDFFTLLRVDLLTAGSQRARKNPE